MEIITFIKNVWSKWLKVARVIGNIQLRIFFSLFYVVLFSPLGIIFRFFQDPLVIHRKTIQQKLSAFTAWEHPEETIAQSHFPY